MICARPPNILRFMNASAWLCAVALVFSQAPLGARAGAEAGEDSEVGEIIDMSPDSPASWSPKYLLAPVISIFRGSDYMYGHQEVVIDTTPSGGYVDLFYVRSGFQKRFEQGEAPLKVLLPSRLKAGPRDSLTIRAFTEGYRQQSVTMKVGRHDRQLSIDLEPLPNVLNGVAHRYFNGRSSISFLTKENLTFRLQEADDGFAVILTETAIGEDARGAVDTLRSPLIAEGYSQQLGEDLMVKVVLSESGAGSEVRSRQSYDAPRDLYAFSLDLVPAAGGKAAVERALEALERLDEEVIGGCSARFDDVLRSRLQRGALARALTPVGSFTDPYVRAAMRRLGEISVDGVVDFVDGSRYRPGVAMELEMSLSNAGEAKGFLALLRGFVEELESEPVGRRESLRSLLGPELAPDRFAQILDDASAAEQSCRGEG